MTQQLPWFGNPTIPIRIPGDDTTFNPMEYPNVTFLAKGKLFGKVRLVHGGPESDNTGQGLISTRIWVVRESDKNQVNIRPTFDQGAFTFYLEGPSDFTSHSIYHETTIQYPRSSSTTESLAVEAPNTSLNGENLGNLLFGTIKTVLSNGSVALTTVHTDIAKIQTSNGSIAGEYDAGHVDFSSSNGSITAKLNIHDAIDGRQSVVSTTTSNAMIDLHVTATDTIRGLWMENVTRNSNLSVAALLGKADRASYINSANSNGKVNFNLDASYSGQPLQVHNKSSNGGVTSSIMIPQDQRFQGSMETSNASVGVNLTEAFQGNFELDTSNGSCKVEGSNLVLQHDKKNSKRGYRVRNDPGHVKIRSSNGSVALRFYPTGQSQASSSY
ncbi:hypothetical protein B0O80DRAFT_428316 [Mortierella sp. GBAus27b]|nr:hypothetical protein B0O80DRAFT_428316 [Mortierella sp. GBAus27b]